MGEHVVHLAGDPGRSVPRAWATRSSCSAYARSALPQGPDQLAARADVHAPPEDPAVNTEFTVSVQPVGVRPVGGLDRAERLAAATRLTTPTTAICPSRRRVATETAARTARARRDAGERAQRADHDGDPQRPAAPPEDEHEPDRPEGEVEPDERAVPGPLVLRDRPPGEPADREGQREAPPVPPPRQRGLVLVGGGPVHAARLGGSNR